MAATPSPNTGLTNQAIRKSTRRPQTRRSSESNNTASTPTSIASSASPALPQKRRRASTNTEEVDDFFDCEPSSKRMASHDGSDTPVLQAILNLGKEVKAMDKKLDNFCTKRDIAEVTKEVRSNSLEIQQMKIAQGNDKEFFKKLIERTVEEKFAASRSTMTGRLALTPYEEEKEKSYLRARRSTRMWPVVADTDDDLERKVRLFILDQLLVPSDIIDMVEIESVEELAPSRRNRKAEEVLVCFSSIELRDLIQTYAVNLAKLDSKAGIRLEIPPFLRNDFKMLEAHGNELRRKYGKENNTVKRAIKFDDADRGLVMDVRLPGSEDWQRIYPWQARQSRNLRQSCGASRKEDVKGDKRFLLLPSPQKTAPNQTTSSHHPNPTASRAFVVEEDESQTE